MSIHVPTRYPGLGSASDAEQVCCLTGGYRADGPQSSVDGGGLEPTGDVSWVKLGAGLFVASQTMMLGLAINLTPPEDAATHAALLWGMAGATLVVALLLGLPLACEAVRALARRRITIEALFLAGLLGSGGISVHAMATGQGQVYFDVVCILLIVYAIGRAIRIGGRNRATGSLSRLLIDLDRVRQVDDAADPDRDQMVSTRNLPAGAVVRILPGSLIPISGRVIQGHAMVSNAAHSGRWLPDSAAPGARVEAGQIAEDGELLVQTAAESSTRLDALLNMVRQADANPAAQSTLADRFVRIFLPVVLLTAMAATAAGVYLHDWNEGLFRGLAVLLVACPCAAGLATPLVIWNLLGHLARRGLLIHGGAVIERLADAGQVVFDKTGTLGDPELTLTRWEWIDSDDAVAQRPERAGLLSALMRIEQASDHPVARAIRQSLGELSEGELMESPRLNPRAWTVQRLDILPGRGIEAIVQGPQSPPSTVAILRATAQTSDDERQADALLSLVVHWNGQPALKLLIAERLRDTALSAIERCKALGLPVTVLTGDGPQGASLTEGIAPTVAGMSGDQKAAWLNLQRDVDPNRTLVMVGDGLNDAAALAQADVGIAIAGGSGVASEAADGILIDGNLASIPQAIELSRRALRRIRGNLALAVSYNITGMMLAAVGILHPVIAVLLMAASSLLVCRRSFTWLNESMAEPDAPRKDTRPSTPSSMKRLPRERWISHERFIHALHGVGWVGLMFVLGMLSGVGFEGTLMLVALGLVIWRAVVRFGPWMDEAGDMTLGMLSIGGLGMMVGWWWDALALPRRSEVQTMTWASANEGVSPAMAACLCCAPTSVGDWTSLLTGMNIGMLALGVPAMFLVRYRPRPWRWGRWCCTGMLLLGVPGMLVGMMVGGSAANMLVPVAGAWQAVVSGAGMMLGMAGGMLLPHALGGLLGSASGDGEQGVGR
ncbi:MAG: heavy metal translocating P-type ATPase [Phycisphaeraceae bacterium]|nr:heavy metal translocating P-type ATPase [Phycisphaeraceae bacterium]